MNRRLNIVGVALVAALAMGAVAASTASAKLGHFERSTSMAVEGVQSGTNVFNVGTHGNSECAVATYQGEMEGQKISEITLTLKYEICRFNGLNGTTVDVNGCDFMITGTTGDAHLKCPRGQSITITVRVTGILKCTIHVPAQTIKAAVTFTNVGTAHPSQSSEVDGDLVAIGITYSTTKNAEGAGTCASTALGHDGAITGKVRFKAAPEGIWVT